MREGYERAMDYLCDKERYADLINAVFFEGRQTVRAEDLQEEDSVLRRRFCLDHDHSDAERDVEFSWKIGEGTVLVATKVLHDVRYALPVTVLREEGSEYAYQCAETVKEHWKKGLPGFSKNDRLNGVITLVLYLGEDKWDGPTSLEEMMNLEGLPELMRKAMGGRCRLNLVYAKDPSIREKFHTDLRQVFGFLANEGDLNALRKYMDENRDFFSDSKSDALDFLVEFSNLEEVQDIVVERDEDGNLLTGMNCLFTAITH